jgi:hypothetical protein
MRHDAKEGLAKIDENRNVEKAVGIKMAEVDSIVFKKIPEERVDRDPKSTNKERHKHNQLMCLRGRE